MGAVLGGLVCSFAACGSSSSSGHSQDGGGGTEGSVDTGTDACIGCSDAQANDSGGDAADSAADSAGGSAPDSAADAVADAPAESSADAAPDAAPDAQGDAAADSAADAPAESSTDAGADASPDASGDASNPEACVPATCGTFQHVYCGSVLDGCGGVIQCSCLTGTTCVIYAGVSGTCCKPITNCSQYPAPEAGTCATYTDNCGGKIHCGNCPSDAGSD
jgi:hypothetical protein